MFENEFQKTIEFWKEQEAADKERMLHSRKAWKKAEREMKKWEVKYSA